MFMKELEEILKKVISDLNYDAKSVKVIKSNRPEICDYQCDDTFKLAKLYHKNPIEIGETIANALNEIEDFDNYFKKVEFVKPGFINMIVSDKFINDNLNAMTKENNFSINKPEKDELYFLDYGGPNVAKPLHIGHLRPAIIGESLKRILNFKGYKTIGDVHLGDFGLQIGQVIYGVQSEGKTIDDITLDYLEYIYPKMSKLSKEDEEVSAICHEITKSIQDGEGKYKDLYNKICEVSIAEIKRIYDYLGVSFDLWNGESDSIKYIDTMIKYLEKKNIVKEDDGAKIIEVKEETDNREIPPFMLQKSDGAFLYSTTDLATIYERMEKYKPDYIIYVVDERQQLHFEQVFRAAKKSEIVTTTKLEHCWFGTMNGLDGKPFKTRNGDLLKLDDLYNQVKDNFIKLKESNKDMSEEDIDIIANAIIQYADLQNNRERNYIFDINKFSDVVGKTGPYILYTYLRINKIISDLEISKLNEKIYNENDRSLRLKLMELELSVDKAVEERMPHYIADYIYDLCVVANTFYQNNRLSDLEDEEMKQEWMYVLSLNNQILKKLLELLLIKIPSVM